MLEFDQFILYFYLPIMVWLILLIVLFVFLLSKYTFGKWTKEEPNPYARETLGLPRGIFRAVLTLSLLFGVMLYELNVMALGKDETQISEFLVAFQMMIAFYFGSKVMHHVASNDRKKTADRAREAVEVARVSGMTFSNRAPQAPTATEPGQNDFYDPESAG